MRYDDLRTELEKIPAFREARLRLYPDEELCLAVARSRARRDMTQEQFARLLKISVAAVRRLESGNLG